MEVDVLKSLKEVTDILIMKGFFSFIGGNPAVIHVVSETFTILEFEGREYFIHETLECQRSIALSKLHDDWLEEALYCLEHCLPLITIID